MNAVHRRHQPHAMHPLIPLSALIVLTGCASVTGSKFQPVMVQTLYEDAAVEGAGCTLTNTAGKWAVKAPGSVRVQKSISDMLVECKMLDGLAGQLAVPSKANPANWGNLLLGGPVGLVVDYQTGAGYDYPSVITVILNKTLDAVVLEPAGSAPVDPMLPPEQAAPAPPSVPPTPPGTPSGAPAQAAAPAPVATAAQAVEMPPANPAANPSDAAVSPPAADKANAASAAPNPAPVNRPRKASSYWE